MLPTDKKVSHRAGIVTTLLMCEITSIGRASLKLGLLRLSTHQDKSKVSPLVNPHLGSGNLDRVKHMKPTSVTLYTVKFTATTKMSQVMTEAANQYKQASAEKMSPDVMKRILRNKEDKETSRYGKLGISEKQSNSNRKSTD